MIMNMTGSGGGKPEFFATAAETEINGGYLTASLTWPEKYNDTPLNTTLNLLINDRTRDMLNYAKKIIIPERFTNVQYGWSGSYYPLWEELHLLGATTVSLGLLNNIKNLKKLKFDKWAGTFEGNNCSILANSTFGQESVSTSFELDCPKVTRFGPYAVGKADHVVEMSVNLPAVTDIGAPHTSCNCLRYATGTWVFPGCKRIGYYARPSVEQTLKLPAIETIYEPFTFGESGTTGKLHLYLGPNATSNYTSWMTAITSYPQLFDVHIPAGSSSTKTLLDAGSVPYTQDYNYTEDL